ncbi:MAG: chorismate mutase [Gaiellaceae bacterium]
MSTDPELERLREEVTAVDASIIDAFNRRLELVAQIKRHKDERGVAFVDRDRERSMFDDQLRRNPGPLSEEGLRALYVEVLALTKRELG